MSLARMANDEVFIIKEDASRLGPYKATVTANVVVIATANLDVTEGDYVARQLPNGKEEMYLITSADFHRQISSLPAHYQLKVRKNTLISAAPPPSQAAPTFNFHNSTGIQIGNHNVQHIQAVLAELAAKIDDAPVPEEQKVEAKSRLLAFLEHPATVAVLGGMASGLMGAM
ncbi:hypothetical protein F3K36_32280 [Delftia sp. BR1]|nr:hypothetical protein F3K36_32280 [Delftia sp. BR1]